MSHRNETRCQSCRCSPRVLIDGRYCRACLTILINTGNGFDWEGKEINSSREDRCLCDGCGTVRDLRMIQNKKTGDKLYICKSCFKDEFFKSPDAFWRHAG